MLPCVGPYALCIYFLMLYVLAFQYYGSCSQDQTSPRANTLPDDADDIQRQLDNEARDRVKYGRAKTIWVFHFPTHLPQFGGATSTRKYISSRMKKQGTCFDPDRSSPTTTDLSWDYKGQGNWKSKFPSCGGCHQSPMELPVRDLTPLKTGVLTFCNFHISPRSMTLTSDSHRITLYGEWPGDRRPTLFGGVVSTRRYMFHSLVFHWPSEHVVGTRRYPLESQAYFVAAEYKDMNAAINATKDPQAILAIASLYNFANYTQPALEPIIEEALYMGSTNESVQPEPLVSFIPVFTDYASYQGSLPIPPCTEVVLWLVPARTLPVTKRAVDIANSHVCVNGVPTCLLQRGPQKLNDRKVYYSEQISRLRASQSPIAISLQKCPTWSSLDALKFKGYWDNEGKGILLNTGQTAYFTLDTANRPRLSGGPLIGEYIFEQMHFHWSVDDFTGCEHVLDGHGYAAECHFVHYNSKYESMEAAVGHADGLAVVGFLLEAVDAPNPTFDKLVEGLDGIQKRDQAVQVTAESLSWMARDDLHEGSYVTYKGSLTTPPYTECVTWIIYEKPVQIGTEQLGLLRQLEGLDSKPIDRNVRPTQRHPLGHSVIYVKQVKAKL